MKLLLCLVLLDFDVVIDSVPVIVVFTVFVGDWVHHVLACVGTPRVDVRLGQHHLLVPPTGRRLRDTVHLPVCSLIKRMNQKILHIMEVKIQSTSTTTKRGKNCWFHGKRNMNSERILMFSIYQFSSIFCNKLKGIWMFSRYSEDKLLNSAQFLQS